MSKEMEVQIIGRSLISKARKQGTIQTRGLHGGKEVHVIDNPFGFDESLALFTVCDFISLSMIVRKSEVAAFLDEVETSFKRDHDENGKILPTAKGPEINKFMLPPEVAIQNIIDAGVVVESVNNVHDIKENLH
jgi:hypothetical protein